MESPLNSSRFPSKSAWRTDTVSDFPNRRGRAMKNCEPTDRLTSGQRRSVLSMYVKPFLTSFSNVYMSVASFSMPHIIAECRTVAHGRDAIHRVRFRSLSSVAQERDPPAKMKPNT